MIIFRKKKIWIFLDFWRIFYSENSINFAFVRGGWVGGYLQISNITKLKKKRKKELTMMFTGEGFLKSRVFESAQKSLFIFPVYRTVTQFAIVVSKAFFGFFFLFFWKEELWF
jgi:hypothetical protein